MKPEAAEVLNALIWAIQEVGAREKIIITSRYKFQFELLSEFWVQGLEAFRKADLEKKLKRLENFNSGKIDKQLIERALKLADGNPRLLEWLDKDVLACGDIDGKLSKLESSSEDWQGKIIWSELYEQIDEKIARVLSHCLVFEIPVPMSALEVVCESISGYKEQLKRGINLGLIEVSLEVEESEHVYRVSRILLHIISSIKFPEVPEVYSFYEKGSEYLSKVWGKRENQGTEKWEQIFRLMFYKEVNLTGITQGFSLMLYVQYNPNADEAYAYGEKLKELSRNRSCNLLEYYLQQCQWIWANEETNRIFYAEYTSGNYHSRHWVAFLRNMPSRLLNEIDKLWTKYSQGKFGFSIQKKIFRILIDTDRDNYYLILDRFSRGNLLKFLCRNKQQNWDNFKRDYEYLQLLTIENFDVGYLPQIRINEVDKDEDSVDVGFSTFTHPLCNLHKIILREDLNIKI